MIDEKVAKTELVIPTTVFDTSVTENDSCDPPNPFANLSELPAIQSRRPSVRPGSRVRVKANVNITPRPARIQKAPRSSSADRILKMEERLQRLYCVTSNQDAATREIIEREIASIRQLHAEGVQEILPFTLQQRENQLHGALQHSDSLFQDALGDCLYLPGDFSP